MFLRIVESFYNAKNYKKNYKKRIVGIPVLLCRETTHVELVANQSIYYSISLKRKTPSSSLFWADKEAFSLNFPCQMNL